MCGTCPPPLATAILHRPFPSPPLGFQACLVLCLGRGLVLALLGRSLWVTLRPTVFGSGRAEVRTRWGGPGTIRRDSALQSCLGRTLHPWPQLSCTGRSPLPPLPSPALASLGLVWLGLLSSLLRCSLPLLCVLLSPLLLRPSSLASAFRSPDARA